MNNLNILYYNLNNNNNDIIEIINNLCNNYIIIIHNKYNYNINNLINKLPDDFDNFADITNNNLCLLYNTKHIKLKYIDNAIDYQLFIFNNIILINMINFISNNFINLLLKIKNINNYRLIIISNFNKNKSNKINLYLHKEFNFKLLKSHFDYIYDSDDNILSYNIINNNLFFIKL